MNVFCEAKLTRIHASHHYSIFRWQFRVPDNDGRTANLSIWNHPGNDTFGYAARSKRMVESVEKIFGEEMYHYHGKLNKKEAKTGGTFMW